MGAGGGAQRAMAKLFVFNGVAELEKQSETGKGRGSLMKGFGGEGGKEMPFAAFVNHFLFESLRTLT